jgi:hypothetical protein
VPAQIGRISSSAELEVDPGVTTGEGRAADRYGRYRVDSAHHR